MTFRFPDKPGKITVNGMENLVDGDWIATIKVNGWRCIVDWDGVSSFSVVTAQNNPIENLGSNVQNELAALLMGLPALQLDCEWVERMDQIYVIGLREWDGEWIGGLNEKVRWDIVQMLPGIRKLIPLYTTTQYRTLFEFSKLIECSEGIVLKHKDSVLCGSLQSVTENKLWFKLKF
jgi:hypothetical protein